MFMGCRQAVGKLRPQSKDLLLRQWSGQFTQSVSRDEFHHEKIHSILRIEVMNSGDIGMVDFRQGKSFLVKTPASRLVTQGSRR